MTNNQRIKLQGVWWPAACRAQGWRASDRALRLRVCAWAVSLVNPTQLELLRAIESDQVPKRILESTSDLDNTGDIDRVKKCLAMLTDDVAQTMEVGKSELGDARRKRDLIRDRVKCLGLFVAQPRRFVASLIEDMFNHGRPGVTIRDLRDEPVIRRGGFEGPSELKRLLMRLSQVVNDKRREALQPGTNLPMTIHEMNVKAGARCYCRQCQHAAGGNQRTELVAEEDWTDFEPEGVLARGGEEEENNPF